MATVQIEQQGLTEVQERLENWGKWQRGTRMCKLGYPGHSNHVFLPTGQVVDYDAEDAEIIEQVLVHLRLERRDLFSVVLQEYCHCATVREGAQRLAMSRTEYCNKKSDAENYVLGYLDALRCFGGVGRVC